MAALQSYFDNTCESRRPRKRLSGRCAGCYSAMPDHLLHGHAAAEIGADHLAVVDGGIGVANEMPRSCRLPRKTRPGLGCSVGFAAAVCDQLLSRRGGVAAVQAGALTNHLRRMAALSRRRPSAVAALPRRPARTVAWRLLRIRGGVNLRCRTGGGSRCGVSRGSSRMGRLNRAALKRAVRNQPGDGIGELHRCSAGTGDKRVQRKAVEKHGDRVGGLSTDARFEQRVDHLATAGPSATVPT